MQQWCSQECWLLGPPWAHRGRGCVNSSEPSAGWASPGLSSQELNSESHLWLCPPRQPLRECGQPSWGVGEAGLKGLQDPLSGPWWPNQPVAKGKGSDGAMSTCMGFGPGAHQPSKSKSGPQRFIHSFCRCLLSTSYVPCRPCAQCWGCSNGQDPCPHGDHIVTDKKHNRK